MDERTLVMETKTLNGWIRIFCEGDMIDVEVDGDMTIAAQTFFKEHLQSHVKQWAEWKFLRENETLNGKYSKLCHEYQAIERKLLESHTAHNLQQHELDQLNREAARSKKKEAARAKKERETKKELAARQAEQAKPRGAFWFAPSLFIREGN